MQRCCSWIFLLFVAMLTAVGCGGSRGSSTLSTDNRWSISAVGGTYALSDSSVRLTVPGGAVTTTTQVSVDPLTAPVTPPSGMVYVSGTGHQFTHVEFASAVTLTLAIPTGTPTTGLKIYRRADGSTEWLPLETTVNSGGTAATASITSFSSYGLFYPAGSGWNWTSVGGTYTFENLSITVPASAVTTDVEVQARRTPSAFSPPPGWTNVANATFDLGSSDTSLTTAVPIEVVISYDASAVPESLRETVHIFQKENETADWVALTSTPDAAGLKVTASATTLGTFAAFSASPFTGTVHWVEQRTQPGQNSLALDVYTATSGASESLVYSPQQTMWDRDIQLRTNTFRWADKTFLGVAFSGGALRLSSFNVETSAATIYPVIPIADGYVFTNMEMVRDNRGTSPYVAIQVSDRLPGGNSAHDRLLLFNGNATPIELLSMSRTDSDPPFVMRPWDVAADGRVLVLKPEGLTVVNGGSNRVLVAPSDSPGQAYFSPDGTRVLYLQQAGVDAGWKVVNIATFEVKTITGLYGNHVVQWADNSHVVAAIYSGDDRKITYVAVDSGASQLITTAGAHSNSFINDIGAH